MKMVLTVAAFAAIALLAPVASAHAVTVYAASSLSGVLPEIDGSARYSNGGSNTLQAQIERGAPADVFASASPDEAQALYKKGLCDRPVTFATNRLVLAVPRSGGSVSSLNDLKGGGKRLSIGSAGVPIGSYTRKLLERMRLSSILQRNTVSNESNVSQVVAKVGLGSADAGFVYFTDANAAASRIRGVSLPRWAQPPVKYQICAVRRSGADAAGAKAFIARVTAKNGRSALKRYGFGLPAKPKPKKRR